MAVPLGVAFLCLLSEDGTDRVVETIALPPAGGVIGRSEDAAVRLHAPSVSRQHARLELADDGWRITALSETNEVLVRGIPCSSTLLKKGNRIQLGTVELRFETRDPRRQRTVAAGEFKPPAQVSRRIELHSRPPDLGAGDELEAGTWHDPAATLVARAETEPVDVTEPTAEQKRAMRAAKQRPERLGPGTMPVITRQVTKREPKPAPESTPEIATTQSAPTAGPPWVAIAIGVVVAGGILAAVVLS